MDNPSQPSRIESRFASAVRDSSSIVQAQREAFLSDAVGVQLLEAMPGPALVLNTRRQVVAANRLMLSSLGIDSIEVLLARRPGEGMGCIHAGDCGGGCGTSEACTQCGVVVAILECLASRGRCTRECRVLTGTDPGSAAHDWRVHATFLALHDQAFVVLGLEDISSEKRRAVLERVFFHDIINLCGGMQGLASLLEAGSDRESEEEFKHDLARLSTMVMDEISSHRQMFAAERGDLAVEVAKVDVAALFAELAAAYRNHPVAEGRPLRFRKKPIRALRTDMILLRRSLGNLVKNALEASRPGETITIGCEEGEDGVVFSVHNPGFIPRDVQLQIFQRSFTTKEDRGHGIGTYSVKLFGEKYLRGHVSFTSSLEAGTTFLLSLPWDIAEQRAA